MNITLFTISLKKFD